MFFNAQDLVGLSLCGNKLENAEMVVREVTKLKNLRGLWLNNNPVLKKWYVCLPMCKTLLMIGFRVSQFKYVTSVLFTMIVAWKMQFSKDVQNWKYITLISPQNMVYGL